MSYRRRIPLALLVIVCSLNFFWVTPVIAQEDKGAIAGTVKDPVDSVLTGAELEIQPLGKRVVTDDHGQYKFTDVTPGEYTLTASYVGFEAFTTTVNVVAGQTATVDAALKIAAHTDQVFVTAERPRGEAEAVNIERTADNIVQVLPAQVIESLPNTNVADAVGRLPSVSLERDEGEGKYVQIRGTEPRLSNLTIDGVNVPSPEGNVRNIKMDIIPAELVERIEVNKTLSASQDADGICGSVNLVTKTPGEKPSYSLSGDGGYTNILGGRRLDKFTGSIAQRFGAEKKLGALLALTYDYNGRGINDLEPGPGVTQVNGAGTFYPYFAGTDFRTYKYYRSRYGASGGLDYRVSPGSSIYFKGLYSDFHDYGETWVYSPGVGALVQPPSGSQYVFDNTGSMQYRHYVRRPDQQVWSTLVGGKSDFGKTMILYDFSVSESHNNGGQDFATTKFYNGPTGIQFGEDLSNSQKTKFPVLNNMPIFDPTTYSLSQVSFPSYHTHQLNLQGAASVARRYTVSSHFSTFQAGFKIRNAHKYQNENDQIFEPNAGTNITLSQTLRTFTNPTYYDGYYQYGPMSDYHKITQLVKANLASGFTYDFNASHLTSDPVDYDGTERVYAGYAMNTIEFGKASLQAGVRFEETHENYNANQINLNAGAFVSATPITGGSNYLNVLPSVQLQYRIEKNTNIRASFGMGISRPNFQDIVPSRQVDPNTSPFPQIVVGNPGLKPTRGNNYDILVEHFFEPLGILQGGFFYKTLTNPIYQTRTRLTGGQFPTYDVIQSVNGPSGHITGLEASWEQRLSHLPGPLAGFGVAANYSYTTSQVTFPAGFNGGRTDHPAVQRQAPNNWNLGLTYDKARFSARFAVSHNDANIYQYFWTAGPDPADPVLGLTGPTGDIYLYAHTQYDVQGSYRMYKGLSVVAYGLNLSNEVFGFYQGSGPWPIQREFYHPTVSIGLRWTSGVE